MKLEALAVGSLPHKDLGQAMALVRENFTQIPFWPQMVNISESEGMIAQFGDFENDAVNALAFELFIKLVKETKPAWAKGQITGPITMFAAFRDKSGRFTDTVVKALTLKALRQVKEIKESSPGTTPVIFIDEPSLSKLDTPAFKNIAKQDIIAALREISDLIKENGGLSALHCCGKYDLTIPISAGVDIMSIDVYKQDFAIFYNNVESFLKNGGKIAWGVVPTLAPETLEKADLQQMLGVFENAVKYLTSEGIDEKIIIAHSLITTSCGAGGLSEELAEKALRLTRELSEALKVRHTSL